MRVRRGHAQTRAKCPAARQTESATRSTSYTDMVPVLSVIGAVIGGCDASAESAPSAPPDGVGDT